MTGGTAIVVVNYASHELLRNNLGAVALPDPTWRVIIVDNFSTERERTAISALCAEQRWELVVSRNDGFGSGVNRGVAAATAYGCSAVILLNPDLHSSSVVLASLAGLAQDEPLTVHCPVILRPDGSAWFTGGDVLLARGWTTTAPGTSVEAATGWVSGACLAFSTALFDRVGGMDGAYFMYWEDVDFSWRCRRAGASLAVHPELTVVHEVGGTQAATGKSPLYVYYNCRNRLLFAAKHLRARDRFRWAVVSLPYARRVLLRGGRRAYLRTAAPLTWASVTGSLSGAVALLRLGDRHLSSRQRGITVP